MMPEYLKFLFQFSFDLWVIHYNSLLINFEQIDLKTAEHSSSSFAKKIKNKINAHFEN